MIMITIPALQMTSGDTHSGRESTSRPLISLARLVFLVERIPDLAVSVEYP
jgi:hypothetical protein